MRSSEATNNTPISLNTEEVIDINQDVQMDKKIGVNCYCFTWRFSKRYFVGLFVLLLTVFIWVLSSELIQYIYEDISFDQPFFLTYFDTTLFSLYLTGFLFMPSWRCTKNSQSLFECVTNLLKNTKKKAKSEDDPVESSTSEITDDTNSSSSQEKLSTWETAKIALIFFPVWFIANYLFNVSLNLTSVASTTIISVTSGLWTLILAAVFGAEKFSVIKTFAVLITIVGVCFVAYDDNQDDNEHYDHPMFGDLLSLISAIFYAIYIVLLKVKIKDENRVSNPMFFGFVGLFNVLTLWPFAIILNYFGIEVWITPNLQTFGYILLNGLIGTALSDYLWLLSVLLTSPVVATLGLSLTIPVSMVCDFIIHGTIFDFVYILGSVLVLIGFVVVNTDNYIKQLFFRFIK